MNTAYNKCTITRLKDRSDYVSTRFTQIQEPFLVFVNAANLQKECFSLALGPMAPRHFLEGNRLSKDWNPIGISSNHNKRDIGDRCCAIVTNYVYIYIYIYIHLYIYTHIISYYVCMYIYINIYNTLCTSLILFISPSNPRRRGADPGTAPPPARRPRGHPCRRLVARGHAARRRSRPRRPPAAVCLADDGGWPPKLSDLSQPWPKKYGIWANRRYAEFANVGGWRIL